jgi:hypothetical protein
MSPSLYVREKKIKHYTFLVSAFDGGEWLAFKFSNVYTILLL